MSAQFKRIIVYDFEYEIVDGGLPNPLCMVAHVSDENLRHVQTIKLWRGEFDATPPELVDDDTLVVAYSGWAELTCHIVLGWKFPKHFYDLHTAYLASSNVLLPYDPGVIRKKVRKRLPDACHAYGIEGWERIDKGSMAKDIGEGHWEKYGKDAVINYCEEDVRMSMLLFRKQLEGHGQFEPIDVENVCFWSEYSAKAVARIQAKGMPIDVPLWNLIQKHKDAVISYLLKTYDPSYGTDNPIYTSDGHWSDARFEQWLIRVGIPAWPRLDSGKIQTDGDAFRMMYGAHTAIAGLHALKDSIGVIVRAKLPIGPDGRNRPSLFPFATATGRNAHAKSLFNAHAAMRGLMLFPSDKIPVYLDWRTQEIGIAAAKSGDQQLMRDYTNGDVYYALAVMCGLTDDPDIKHWKANNKAMRNRMKALQLGINYGMSVTSLSKGLNRHPVIGSHIIEMHKRRYPPYWQWKEESADTAMQERKMESVFNWPLYVTNTPNRRTLYNFPMQSGGADMLQLATVRLCEAGIVPSMLVHDAILLEANNEEEIAAAVEIMKQAGRDTCGGFEIGVDVEYMKDGRFRDKRDMAVKMWGTIIQALKAVGALPEEYDNG